MAANDVISFRVSPANSWIHEIPMEERDFRINSMLHLARRAESAVIPTVAPPGMDDEMRAAMQRLHDKMDVAIPHALHVRHNSSAKGNAAEATLDETIAEHFPSLILTDSSQTPHHGDRMLVDNLGEVSIMIEYKDYRTPVPTAQVTKFERDARETGVTIALMVAFETHIARKPKNRLSIEQRGATTLVFLPNAGRDGSRLLPVLVWAEWVCRRQYHAAQTHVDHVRPTAEAAVQAIDEAARELQLITDHLRSDLERLDRVRLAQLTAIRTRLGGLM